MSAGGASFSPAMESADGYNRWVLDTLAPALAGTVLEVGFGHGGFRRLLPPAVQHVAVDVDPEVVRRARERDPGALVFQADVSSASLLDALHGRVFDVVLCINVLEHVRDDRSAVRNLLSCLRPGGRLCLFVPALPALFNRLDLLAGHMRRYRRDELASLVPEGLARVVRIEYFNPVGGLGWWLNGIVPHRELGAPSVGLQVRLFDRVVRPLSMRLNRLTRGFFGQSLLAVVETAAGPAPSGAPGPRPVSVP